MENEIKKIMESVLKISVDDTTNRQKIDVWDSFNHLDILATIGKKYGISFTPEEMASINSYKDLYDMVKSKTEK